MQSQAQMRHHVLFVGNGNAARSILAEAYLNWAGKDRFIAFSAGRNPTGKVDPLTLEILEHYRLDARSARSKGWDEFFAPNFERVDLVLTMHHRGIDEVGDFWPRAITANWRIGDPTLVLGDLHSKRRAFIRAFAEVTAKVNAMLDLPLGNLSARRLKMELQEIGTAAGKD